MKWRCALMMLQPTCSAAAQVAKTVEDNYPVLGLHTIRDAAGLGLTNDRATAGGWYQCCHQTHRDSVLEARVGIEPA